MAHGSLTSGKYGLFHLRHIRTPTNEKNLVADFLFKCVREAADSEQVRDIPLEDYYRQVMSFCMVRDHVFLLRFSRVGPDGKGFGNVSVADTLHDITLILLKGTKWDVISEKSKANDWAYYYNPKDMAETEYMYVPNNFFVKTYVIRSKTTLLRR